MNEVIYKGRTIETVQCGDGFKAFLSDGDILITKMYAPTEEDVKKQAEEYVDEIDSKVKEFQDNRKK